MSPVQTIQSGGALLACRKCVTRYDTPLGDVSSIVFTSGFSFESLTKEVDFPAVAVARGDGRGVKLLQVGKQHDLALVDGIPHHHATHRRGAITLSLFACEMNQLVWRKFRFAGTRPSSSTLYAALFMRRVTKQIPPRSTFRKARSRCIRDP